MVLLFLITLLNSAYSADHIDFYLDKEYCLQEQKDVIFMAIDDINKALGCQSVTIKEKAFVDPNDNYISFDPSVLGRVPGDWVAWTFIYPDYVQIGLELGLESQKLYNTIIHEIGHSLGLAHNFNKRSIMFPYVEGGVPLVSNFNKIYRKYRWRWSHQLAILLKKKNPNICLNKLNL